MELNQSFSKQKEFRWRHTRQGAMSPRGKKWKSERELAQRKMDVELELGKARLDVESEWRRQQEAARDKDREIETEKLELEDKRLQHTMMQQN